MNLISTAKAAELIGVSEVSLHKWRKRGVGPTVYPNESGKRFRYDKAECQRFARDRDRLHSIEKSVLVLLERVETLECAVIAMSEG